MGRCSRRDFLLRTSILATGCFIQPTPTRATTAGWSSSDPFSLGVASSPTPDGFVLWTRLAPTPLSSDPDAPGGVRPDRYSVRYEIATDPEMRKIVRRGEAIADGQLAYSVHLEVIGLRPARPYWYRFSCRDAESRVGRAMTLPGPNDGIDALRLGFVSCSNYEHGYFSAYRHLTDEGPDVALFLGDYIYEYIAKAPDKVRVHSDGVEATTLPLYRNRYAQYRLDDDLQRLHAEVPMLITWDDHEVQNDYADQWAETFDDPQTFLKRRAAAYQAFYEHMPIRPSRWTRQGPDLRIYDRFRFGRLAEISMLDGRQYRNREACYGPPRGGGHLVSDGSCPERLDPSRTMLGTDQEKWLYEGLAEGQARWNILAQDVLMTELRERNSVGEIQFWSDDWNGYPAARQRLMQQIHDCRVSNPVVFSGDIHSYWVNDLKLDYDRADAPVIATEFVGTSVSAHPPPYDRFARYAADNPHVRYFESRKRGYVTVDVEAERLTTKFRSVSDATIPDATVETLKSFIVQDGRPGANSI